MHSLGYELLLLPLLLLLRAVDHAALGERDRLAQHVDIADVVGEDQDQRRVEIGALRVGEAAMGLDDRAEGVVGPREIRAG